MSARRIDFMSANAAQFNDLLDVWSKAASGGGISKSGLRIGGVLPAFVNREHGYAFPTDGQLADAITADKKTVHRGLTALENAGLIERFTRVKRDDKGEAIGKLRRIYLCLPEVKGQKVKGHAEVKGQNRQGEGTPVCHYIPDNNTPDTDSPIDGNDLKVIGYARESVPPVCGDDFFVETFDRIVVEMTHGREIGAGEIERIVQEAFDGTAKLDTDAAPIDWQVIRELRQRTTEDWFRSRAGQLIHRQAA